MTTFSKIPNSSAKSSPDIFPLKKYAGSGKEPEYIFFSFGYNMLKPLVGTLTLSEKESFLGCEKQTAFSLSPQR